MQLYGLKGTAPGAFVSEHDDVKYASVSSTCASGTPLGEDNVDAASRATSTTVAITTMTGADVAGTIDLTFEDGSSVKGTFEASFCSVEIPEDWTCL